MPTPDSLGCQFGGGFNITAAAGVALVDASNAKAGAFDLKLRLFASH
jgi:hypothetical protein